MLEFLVTHRLVVFLGVAAAVRTVHVSLCDMILCSGSYVQCDVVVVEEGLEYVDEVGVAA